MLLFVVLLIFPMMCLKYIFTCVPVCGNVFFFLHLDSLEVFFIFFFSVVLSVF